MTIPARRGTASPENAKKTPNQNGETEICIRFHFAHSLAR